MRHLHNKESTIARLEDQLVELKKGIATSGRTIEQISDEVLIERMTNLFNDVQNMIANTARGRRLGQKRTTS